MTLIRLSAALALTIALRPAPVSAQAKCEIDYKKPGQVKDAASALDKSELPIGKPEDKTNSMKQAVTLLTKEPDKIDNAPARAMLLGRAYSNLALLPGNLGGVKRGTVGLATEPDGSIDLIAAADSAFDVVEAANPGCKDETEPYRRKIYAQLVNDAVNQYNQRAVDSAGSLAKRALQVYDGYKLAYIAHNVYGNVLQSKDSIDAAIASFQRMAELQKGDTSLVDERKNTMLSISSLMMSQGDNLEGDAKKAKMQQAAAYLEGYLKEFPGDAKAEAAQARAQIASGDTGAADRVFGQMAANPDKYSDAQLFEAGVNAARSDRSKEAASLFEAGLKKNPYSRDGLFNLAVTYQSMNRWDDMPQVVNKLIEVDPENPENYRLWAIYYQTKAKLAKDAAGKKPATSPEAKAYAALNDSLLHYFKRFQEAPAKVTFSLWSHDGAKHVVGGSVENLSDATKSYPLKFEFLNASGAVVGTKQETVADVAAKGQKSFRIEVEGEGIVAFRYAPFGG